MPSSKQASRRGSSAVSQPSKEHAIKECLKIQLQTFPQKELFPEETDNWLKDLEPFTIQAIEWSFDNWRRNGRFFPVYGDIIDQCIAYQPASQKQHACAIECRERHGKGYAEADIVWLMKRYMAKRETLSNRALTDSEVDVLLDELDTKRGQAPEWRQ